MKDKFPLLKTEKEKLGEKFPRLVNMGEYFTLYWDGSACLDGNFELDELKAIVESLERILKREVNNEN